MRNRICLIITLLIVGLMIGCNQKAKQEKKTAEFSGAKYVKTQMVQLSDIESTMDFQGKVMAEQLIDIAPTLPVKIDKILVQEGNSVKKGDLLALMDKNTLIQLESSYRNIEKNYLRSKALYENQALDQRTFDDMEALYTSSKANYETSLDNLQIRAPFDGVVTAVTQKEGETFNSFTGSASGVNGLFRLMKVNKMKAVIALSDKDLVFVKKGNSVKIYTDVSPEHPFTGVVRTILPEASLLSGLYTCEISLNNSNQSLRHNQFARVVISKEKARQSLIIPVSALLDSSVVYSVEKNKAKKNNVRTGIINKDFVQILSGLKAGDQVIIEGSLGLEDGSDVIVKN